jgi:peroxiredoxin Q/BCP
LKTGDVARDFNYHTPWEDDLNFFAEIENKNIILIFLRYIGCPVCKVEMANLKKNFDLIESNDVSLFVVLQSTRENILTVTNEEDWKFTIVCDPDAVLLKLYNVDRGNLFRYLHPSGLKAAYKAVVSGYKHGKFEGVETQLPATFVISPDKIVNYAHYGKVINDVPSIDFLISKIE